MNPLDEALSGYLQDENQQEPYYRLVLDSELYIPLQQDDSDTPMEQRDSHRPLLLESEGKHYMLLFDSEERLKTWANKDLPFVILTGLGAATISTAGLHWALNVGSKFAKEFVPDEIQHLRALAAAE